MEYILVYTIGIHNSKFMIAEEFKSGRDYDSCKLLYFMPLLYFENNNKNIELGNVILKV